MIKSPLRYPGGKSRAVEFLENHLPEFSEFREVFFGGGSLTYFLIQKYPTRKYLASDLNFELYCFWSQLKENHDVLIYRIQQIYDEAKNVKVDDNYNIGKKLFSDLVDRRDKNISDIERAIDFFILNRITFSGVVDSGGYSQGSFNGRFTQSSIHRLKESIPIVTKIDFFCEDYNYLLQKKGKNVLIFLDPPYYSATKSKLYGKNGILHTQFDHNLLCDRLIKSEYKWIITYDNSDFIRELYNRPGIFQKEWKLQYGMTNRNNATSRKGNELLIANYDLNNIQKQLTLFKK